MASIQASTFTKAGKSKGGKLRAGREGEERGKLYMCDFGMG